MQVNIDGTAHGGRRHQLGPAEERCVVESILYLCSSPLLHVLMAIVVNKEKGAIHRWTVMTAVVQPRLAVPMAGERNQQVETQ
jgi:hypothetical protein